MNAQLATDHSTPSGGSGDFLAPRFYRLFLRLRPAPLGVMLKKLLRVKRQTLETRRGSFYIDPASSYGLALLEFGEYEAQMIAVLEAVLKQGTTFVDIGANEGYLSVLASKLVGRSGKVIGVEPQQRLRPVLAKNFQLNGSDNIEMVHCAISNRSGQAALHVSPDTNTGSTSLLQTTKYRLPTEVIETITLEELFARHGIERADLMKMDIEGYEYEAILGSPSLFEEHRIRVLALELHPKLIESRGFKTDDIIEFLHGCGYVRDERFHGQVFIAPRE